MTKRRIYATALAVTALALIVFIFSNSLTTAEQSQQQSDGIVDKVSRLLNGLGVPSDAEMLSFIIRKLAHFTEHFLLGGLIYGASALYGAKRPFVISIIICLTVAVGDEFIAQRMTEGRSPEIRDCIIDLCGAASISTALHFITRKRYSDM